MDVQDERLTKILSTWESRAQVRQHSLAPDSAFEPDKRDFLPSWLPFAEHPTYTRQIAAAPALEQHILSAAWLQYNQVTLDIENDIVVPLCVELQDQLRDEPSLSTLIIQAMIDESYHVLLTAHACAMTRRRRGLEQLHVGKSHLVAAMRRCQHAHADEWQRRLILLATGIVTEVFIGAYLADVATCKDPSLQPLNVLVTRSHMIDEAVHGYVFAAVAEYLVPRLGARERALFWTILPQTVLWFFAGRCAAWQPTLTQLGFTGVDAMLAECRKPTLAIFAERHWPAIESLAERLGCPDFRALLVDAAVAAERER